MLLPDSGRVAIGSGGLRPLGGAVVASKCGVVRRSTGGMLWVEGRQKRYIPAEGDTVIGVVVDRLSEVRCGRLDAASAQAASLAPLSCIHQRCPAAAGCGLLLCCCAHAPRRASCRVRRLRQVFQFQQAAAGCSGFGACAPRVG
jgi:hypothetical protein